MIIRDRRIIFKLSPVPVYPGWEFLSHVDAFLEYLNSLPNWLIYILLGLSALVENVFPPVPGDTITAFGAFLVGTQRLSFLGVYISTTVGSLCGFMALFWVGSILGRKFFLEKDYRFFKAADILKAERWFRKYGYFLVLLNRFFPGIRSVISVAGGISKLKTVPITLLALISACAWNLLWILAGYFLGTNWETAKETFSVLVFRYNVGAVIVLSILAGAIIIYTVRKRRKK
jgi:membrane protein DedA with SNARE-associated domain